MRTIEVTLEGQRMLMKNVRLADPLDEYAKAMKAITNKPAKKKGDADHLELSRLEFQGGLWYDDKLGPIVPGDAVEAVIVNGFRRSRKGKDAEAGIIAAADAFPLEYEGPRSRDGLWKDKRFVDRRGAGIKQAKVMRTRPIFKNGWKVTFQIRVLDDSINTDDIRTALDEAGKFIGLGDWRPKYGTFTVVSFKELQVAA